MLFCALLSFPALSQYVDAPANIHSAVFTLGIELEMEKQTLSELNREYTQLINKRTTLLRRISSLYSDLDRYFNQSLESDNVFFIEETETNIDDLESRLSSLRIDSRMLRNSIKMKTGRIAVLEEKMDELTGRLPSTENTVSGKWSFTMMPNRITGEIVLLQQGTVISGEYSFEGGWTGSFTGHIANRRIVMERIDSALGRVGTFMGALSEDGSSITGSWENYEFSRPPVTGSWSASRMD